jgi:hypothetical protein
MGRQRSNNFVEPISLFELFHDYQFNHVPLHIIVIIGILPRHHSIAEHVIAS